MESRLVGQSGCMAGKFVVGGPGIHGLLPPGLSDWDVVGSSQRKRTGKRIGLVDMLLLSLTILVWLVPMLGESR